jgi:hypothetical protein
MNAIVLISLMRLYIFVVFAILILIFGGRAVLRTPTDIFPQPRRHRQIRRRLDHVTRNMQVMPKARLQQTPDLPYRNPDFGHFQLHLAGDAARGQRRRRVERFDHDAAGGEGIAQRYGEADDDDQRQQYHGRLKRDAESLADPLPRSSFD